jgi:hypothetical protein
VAEQFVDPAPRVRLARITDLAALVAISRRAHDAALDEPAEIRSLGLPIAPAALSLYQLFRMPLSLIRSSDSIWVHQRGSALDGLARVERDLHGEWTIVELSAVDDAARARLLARVVREAGRHGVARVHVACREDAASLTLLGAAGFQVYARETLYALQTSRAAALSELGSARGVAFPLRPAASSDALPIAQLMARVTPPAVARVELTDARDWGRATTGAWAPRASISPLLRLVDGSAFVVDGDASELDGWVHIGVAREPGEQHPHSMRITTLPSVVVAPIIAASLAEISARATEAGTGGGVILAVVRSYESAVGTALRAHGFEEIADLRLAVRDARARVTSPGMIPAIG